MAHNRNWFTTIGLAASIIIIAIFSFAVFLHGRVKPNPAMDAFAKCLAEKGITMYGAYWCPHCKNEKQAFGSSFQYVPYVECTKEIEKCLSQKIDEYPTWIFPDGRKLEGEQGIAKLAAASGCPIP